MAASSQKGQFEPYHSHPSICDRIGRAGMLKRRLQPGKPGGFYGVDVQLGSSAEFKRRMADFLNSFQ
ncbi:MAG TPA: hypothetical protein VM822_05620 [Pseudolabrys sp.]|nr:hypothetical protein [Pseudolabrys sp.]